MPPPPVASLLALCVLAACHGYEPAPVDLREHARAFAERLPDPATLAAFAGSLRSDVPADAGAADAGISLAQARRIALVFHPDCRESRLRAGVAEASAREAGNWPDPVLGGDVSRILEDVAHPWLAAGSLALTLPLSGRLGLEQDLADGRHGEALLHARLVELQVMDRVDAAWASWSADRLRAQLLREHNQRLQALEQIALRLASAEELTRQQARVFTLERLHRETELAAVDAAVAQGELELKQLLGMHPRAPLRFAATLAIPSRMPAAPERDERLFDSPRLQPLQQAHVVAERHLRLAVRKQWPDLVLAPGFEEEDAQPRAALGFSLPIPLFAGNDREIAEASAERDLAAEVLRAGYERLVQDLAVVDLRLQAARSQRELVETRLLPLAEEQVADAQRQAELGQLDPLLILDSLVRSHDAKAMAVDVALAEALATSASNALFWPAPLPTVHVETSR